MSGTECDEGAPTEGCVKALVHGFPRMRTGLDAVKTELATTNTALAETKTELAVTHSRAVEVAGHLRS